MGSRSIRSFIHPQLADGIHLPRRRLKQPQEFVCANGEELTTLEEPKGTAIQIGSRRGKLDLLLTKSLQRMLLGFDFLQQHCSR